MKSVLNLWTEKVPNYSTNFKDSIFKKLSNFGGGSEDNKIDSGSVFSNGYELYMYAFFLGFYNERYSPLQSPKQNFSVPIKDWGRKSNRLGRLDFTNLQEHMFYACFIKSNVDWIEVNKGSITIEYAIKELLDVFEAYANGGFEIIKDQISSHPALYRDKNSFFELIDNAMNKAIEN